MADPLGIIGLTGTAKQLVRLTKHLIDSHKALKENRPAAEELLRTYVELQSMLNDLSPDSYKRAKPSHVRMVNHEMDTIKKIFTEAATRCEKQHESSKSDKWISQYLSALSNKADIEKLKTDANDIRQCMFRLSMDENINWLFNNSSNSDQDRFCAVVWAETNPTSIYINLNAKDKDGQPNTCESKLKEAVLRGGPETHVGAIAIGQGGVGKTCTLRAIANDTDVQERFPGGVYFLSLGKDASIGTIIQQLCVAVKASGGLKLASKLQAEKNLESVVAGGTTVVRRAFHSFHFR